MAVRGTGRAVVLDAFGLRPTGAREEVVESPLVGAELPGGWYLLVANHGAQRSLDHLDAEGALPETFSGMRDRARVAQRAAEGGVDHFFDVPVALAKALTGYRHDEDPPGASGEPFEVLAAAAGGGPKSWLGRLFGRV